jgi:hypothetical protein
MNEMAVYKIFDRYGICFRRQTLAITIEIDPDSEDLIKTSFPNERTFEPLEIPGYKLDSSEIAYLFCNYVYDTTGYKIQDLKDIFELEEINGTPFFLKIQSNEISKFWMRNHSDDSLDCIILSKQIIPGTITFRSESKIKTLGNIREISESLYIWYNKIENLGLLEIVNGDLCISQNKDFINGVNSLGQLKFVGGNLYLRNSNITELGNLEAVGGNVNFRGLELKSLGALKIIGGNALLPKKLKGSIELNSIDINGTCRFYNS